MKKNIISLVAVCLLGALFTVMAGEVKAIKTPYWQDIQTVSVNKTYLYIGNKNTKKK